MNRVIIDTDPGTDDAIALIAALNSPELDVTALTTVTGNASLEDATRNALGLLACLGQSDIPVYVGADTPLIGKFQFAENYHGPGGMTTPLPEPESVPSPIPAERYIRDACPGIQTATSRSSHSVLSPTSRSQSRTNRTL